MCQDATAHYKAGLDFLYEESRWSGASAVVGLPEGCVVPTDDAVTAYHASREVYTDGVDRAKSTWAHVSQLQCLVLVGRLVPVGY